MNTCFGCGGWIGMCVGIWIASDSGNFTGNQKYIVGALMPFIMAITLFILTYAVLSVLFLMRTVISAMLEISQSINSILTIVFAIAFVIVMIFAAIAMQIGKLKTISEDIDNRSTTSSQASSDGDECSTEIDYDSTSISSEEADFALSEEEALHALLQFQSSEQGDSGLAVSTISEISSLSHSDS